jgi:glyoxylase-like metal-dependent hydrolase (beta-lactamase superfamily II)
MKGTLSYERLDENIVVFNEKAEENGLLGPHVDAYLIAGSRKAILVDALEDDESLYEAVRSITRLPVDVLITHAHPDHAGVSVKKFYDSGCPVYLHKDDFPLLHLFGKDEAMYTPLEEGMVFDTGSYRLETLLLPGHTPGSAVFLESSKRHLYTGDAIGSGGFWMQIPGTLPLRKFRANAEKVWDRVKTMKDLRIFPGHRHQAARHDYSYFETVLTLTDKIISGEIPGEKRVMSLLDKTIHYRSAAYETVTDYCFLENNI